MTTQEDSNNEARDVTVDVDVMDPLSKEEEEVATVAVVAAAAAPAATPAVQGLSTVTTTKSMAEQQNEQDAKAKRLAAAGRRSGTMRPGAAVMIMMEELPTGEPVEAGATMTERTSSTTTSTTTDRTSVVTASSSFVSSVTTPPPKPPLQSEQQDSIAKRRAGAGRRSGTIRPGAVMMTSMEESAREPDSATSHLLEPTPLATVDQKAVANSKTVSPPTATLTVNQRTLQLEEDAKIKGRAAAAVGRRSSTLRPGAVMVVESPTDCEPEVEPATIPERGTSSMEPLKPGVTAPVSPSTKLTVNQRSTWQHEDDARIKHRAAAARAAAGARRASRKDRSVIAVGNNTRPGAVAIANANAAATTITMEPEEAPNSSTRRSSASSGSMTLTSHERDARIKSRSSIRRNDTNWTTTPIVRPGAVAVQEPSSAATSNIMTAEVASMKVLTATQAVFSQQTQQAQRDAALKTSLRTSISSRSSILKPGTVVMVEEPSEPEVEPRATVPSVPLGSLTPAEQQDALVKARVAGQRPSRRTSSRMSGSGLHGGGGGGSKERSALSYSNSAAPESALTQAEQNPRSETGVKSGILSIAAGNCPAIVKEVTTIGAKETTSTALLTSSSVQTSSNSLLSSTSSMGLSTDGLHELERREELRAAARAIRRSTLSGSSRNREDGSTTICNDSLRSLGGSIDRGSVRSSFAGMLEDESQHLCDPEMSPNARGTNSDVESGAVGATRDATADGSGQTSDPSIVNGSSSSLRTPPRTLLVFSNMSEEERQSRYDAKMALMEKAHEDSRERRVSEELPLASTSALMDVAAVSSSSSIHTGTNRSSPRRASTFSNTSEAERERLYDAKMADMF